MNMLINRQKMKKDKRIYWITTGIVALVMVYSILSFTFFDHVIYPEGAFNHLKLPPWFKVEITTAKILGVIALLLPGIPAKIKEFTYFGFAITLLSAGFAHFSVGDGFLYIIDPLIFLCILIVSYRYFNKLKPSASDPASRIHPARGHAL
jgi:hypothetical protein